jgi:hypothetical protein
VGRVDAGCFVGVGLICGFAGCKSAGGGSLEPMCVAKSVALCAEGEHCARSGGLPAANSHSADRRPLGGGLLSAIWRGAMWGDKENAATSNHDDTKEERRRARGKASGCEPTRSDGARCSHDEAHAATSNHDERDEPTMTLIRGERLRAPPTRGDLRGDTHSGRAAASPAVVG